jgi:hypothetical protein
MTSAHHPQSRIIVRCFQERRQGREGIRGPIALPAIARRGGAKQTNTLSLHLSTERGRGIMPVQKFTPALMASGSQFVERGRADIACRHVSRVSSEVSHVVSPCRVALASQEQLNTAGIPDGDKPTAQAGKVTARGGNA